MGRWRLKDGSIFNRRPRQHANAVGAFSFLASSSSTINLSFQPPVVGRSLRPLKKARTIKMKWLVDCPSLLGQIGFLLLLLLRKSWKYQEKILWLKNCKQSRLPA